MLAEAEMSVTQMAMDTSQEDPVFAKFYMHAKEDKAKTKEEGRPIFKDVPYIMIIVPGKRAPSVNRPLRVGDRERFPKQWAAFENQQEQPIEGTPLAQWPGVTRSQAEELAYYNIKTVESLATVPDSTLQNFMGGNALKAKAAEYIKLAKEHAPIAQLQEENNNLKLELEALKDQFQQLLEQQQEADEE